ncbi:hypothetical protein A9404_07775 [Halothiobacillus diazotrophicus]|uniref:Cell division protein ZipA n=1 Tax=Halothiobacillus diazotrophicus TaxID=1860122 RepID=A0A191ZHG4_9GAMM|nr:cell division protein ZipA C-terminal FtsZ-binding domain-containing protein [Halothiobacillus diazotrophicus]ANJ67293.1 hypothetical protein A9404_07775 [Halothiobacillus diazotrophicus]
MEWLRWILLAAGVVTLIGIAWIYFRHKSEQAIELGSGRTEANLDDPIDVRIRAQETHVHTELGADLHEEDDVPPATARRAEPRLDAGITPASEPFEVEPEPLRWSQPNFTRHSDPKAHDDPPIDIDFSDAEGILGTVRRTPLHDDPTAAAGQPGGLFQQRQGTAPARRFSYQEKTTTPPGESEAASTPAPTNEVAPPEPTQEERQPVVLPLLIASPDAEPFDGERVQSLIEEIGFEFGDLSIYHYPDEMGEPLFSLMNGVQPGTFDRGNVASFSTPLLAIFMQLPLASPGETLIFERMLDIARDIADQLGGEILDDQRQPLSSESIDRYRELLHS